MKKNNISIIFIIVLFLIVVIFLLSILTGKYYITLKSIIEHNEMSVRVFYNLRLPRSLMGLLGGFGLGIAGFIYQTVFRNNLASPDIVGVSSGASVGAAFSIIFISSATFSLTLCSFVGGILAVSFALILAKFIPNSNNISIVFSGIIVQSIFQTILMILKIVADPDKQLASIEYWIMGGLNEITADKVPISFLIIIITSTLLIMLHRQTVLLSINESEAKMLGISVEKMRFIILIIATFLVASIISVTGSISYIGLLAPHIAKIIIRGYKRSTLIFSGLVGSVLLLSADLLAKTLYSTELPVSIFTSIIGAPALTYFILSKKGGRNDFN